MKKVFTDFSEVAHLWANKQQDYATNPNRSYYFRDDTIYSYGNHFPIAKHISHNEEEAILFTTRTYSNTTVRHISVTIRACRHKNIIYCYDPTGSHETNIHHYISEIEQEAHYLLRARKPEKYINNINNIIDKAKKYLQFFGLNASGILEKAFSITNSEKYKEYITEKNDIILKEELKKKQEAERKFKKNLKKWKEGELNYLYSNYLYSNIKNQDYLRIKDEYIQTSQGVKLSIPTGREIFKRIKENSIVIGDKVLSYIVTEIGKNYKIGCHIFPKKYLLEWGTKNL